MAKMLKFVRNLWVKSSQQPVYSIDILRRVRKNVEKSDVYFYDGLCTAIYKALRELNIPFENYHEIVKHILDRDTARMRFGASDDAYWWKPGEWDERKQYLDFQIRNFKYEKINWRLV